MRIIKEGSIEKNGKCQHCGTEFAFTEDDCFETTKEMGGILYKLRCPLKACGKQISIHFQNSNYHMSTYSFGHPATDLDDDLNMTEIVRPTPQQLGFKHGRR